MGGNQGKLFIAPSPFPSHKGRGDVNRLDDACPEATKGVAHLTKNGTIYVET
ncbi:MAG TPA: hypothetical protein ACFYEJ_10835 [Candidatus Wujingus californicus]|uniref:hypothetical protein n=1 Tax=Candidatus Wujingus californicus TaxID=3367618 RepID=UPI001DEECCBD|nr:hypothetical protein [Planctomycetota bacterium]